MAPKPDVRHLVPVAAACLIAWVVHDGAGPQPTGSAKAHAAALLGHHGGANAYVPPPPVTAETLGHLLGVAVLVVLPAALVATAARALTRRHHGVSDLVLRAALTAAGCAAVAALTAVLTLGGSVADETVFGAATLVGRVMFVVAAVCAAVSSGRRHLR